MKHLQKNSTHSDIMVRKEKELKESLEAKGFLVIEIRPDDNENLQILVKRPTDGTYIVWTSYYTGEEKTSYSGVYNGTYDLHLSGGVSELARRLNRDKIDY